MSYISRLENNKAALSILYCIFEGKGPIARTQLFEVVEQFDIGRTAIYSSLEILQELNLIKVFSDKYDVKTVKMTTLTEKGVQIAELLTNIEKILENDS